MLFSVIYSLDVPQGVSIKPYMPPQVGRLWKGSLGAPGFGFGWAPAVSFNGHDEDAILNAYVTPIPEVEKDSFNERDWQRIRAAIINVYGDRPRRRAA